MKKTWNRNRIMNVTGCTLLIIAAALMVLLFLLQYDELWVWYKVYQQKLIEVEHYIESLGIGWKFVLAMLLMFLVRTFVLCYLRFDRCCPAVILVSVCQSCGSCYDDEYTVFHRTALRQRKRMEIYQQE